MLNMKNYVSVTRTIIFLLFGLVANATTQENSLNLQEIGQQLPDLKNVQNLNELNVSSIPELQKATNLFKQKCEKNGGHDAFENAKHAQKELEQCLKSLINSTELQAEMENAKPKGELDEVFKKYCRKSPTLKSCAKNFTTAIEPCLEEKEKENNKIIMNITESLLTFVCYKEGDRIALFISAGGPECFQSKQQEIKDCANATFGSLIPTSDSSSGAMPGIENLPSLIFGNKECTDMNNLQNCVVKVLELCSDPTPANIVDSIFKFIKKATPCENLLNARFAASTGLQEQQISSTCTTEASITITGVTIILLQFLHNYVT